MKELKAFSRNIVALVDDEDYERCLKYNWTYSKGYFSTRIGRHKVPLHRFILNLTIKLYVDHIDNNGLNNQKINLRIVTQQVNILRKKAYGKYRWVSFDKSCNKFYARVRLRGSKRIVLSFFDNPIDSFKEAIDFMRRHYPELNDDWDKLSVQTL